MSGHSVHRPRQTQLRPGEDWGYIEQLPLNQLISRRNIGFGFIRVSEEAPVAAGARLEAGRVGEGAIRPAV